MPSHQQFYESLESSFMYLAIIGQVLAQMNRSQEKDEYIVDASAMPICKIVYANQASLGQGLADYEKTLEGWFFGFKIHLIINKNMEIVSFKFSPASTSDIAALDEKMVRGLIKMD
ncbi:MAG TPA: transposase [Candidatus Babeliales bacterium]|nr:transposase [Candidatus Babeliales bacterium]